MTDEPGKHLTEALGGEPTGPIGPEERIEYERARNLIRSVASCYNSLAVRETDPQRQAELVARRNFQDDEFRRIGTMADAERRTVLGTYPELLARLRAELDAG
jgi:hypothetical protein